MPHCSSGRCHLLPDLLLWLRLRPGGERFVIFMQVRSALMVLCKLVVLNMLLYFLQATSWTHCSTWVFLTLTAPAWFRQLPSPCSSLPSPFSTDWLYLVRQNRKPWRIFISHHKCSRQLCVTSEDPAQKTGSACNVFLDTDNLRDLTELFNFVRDTETLTILASPGTSASACAVHSAVVRWPNFTDPSATTHEDLSFASPFLVKEDLELSGEGAPSSRQERGFVPDLL
eukprot:s1162_g17.t3